MSRPTFGPVDFIVLSSPDQTMPEEVDAAIRAVAASDAVSVIDLVHLAKSPEGEVLVTEIEALPQGDPRAGLELTASGLASDDDIAAVAENMAPGSSAVVLVVEHTWARELVEAVVDTSAELVAAERVPAALVNEVIRAVDATTL